MIVVDASIAVMWFLPEPASPAARALLVSGEVLAAPDWIHVEVAAALFRAAGANRISVADSEQAITGVMLESLASLPALPLVREAFRLAAQYGGTVYDALYVACARTHGIPLVTADKAMAAVARKVRVPVSTL